MIINNQRNWNINNSNKPNFDKAQNVNFQKTIKATHYVDRPDYLGVPKVLIDLSFATIENLFSIAKGCFKK